MAGDRWARSDAVHLPHALRRLGLDEDANWIDVVRRVQALPYGRTSRPDAAAVLEEGRGTCSTKHYLLYQLLRRGWPELEVVIVHRVYRLTRQQAGTMFGPRVAAVVPDDGITDVHTYLQVYGPDASSSGTVDATMPTQDPWDGTSAMALACGPGTDHRVDGDAAALKARLVQQHCEPALRERFVAALSQACADVT